MARPAVPLLKEPKNMCTPKVQLVPALASACAAGGSRATAVCLAGTGREPRLSRSPAPVPGVQGHLPGSWLWLQSK